MSVKPFPLYTDGVNLYTSFDGGVTLLPVGSGGAQNVGEYDLIVDFTTTGDQGIIVPARVGQVFVITRWSQLVLALTGTASGTAPTVSCGVSSAFTNVFAAAAGQTVGGINAGPGQFSNVSVSGANAPMASNAALHIAVGTAVTGATALTCRVSVFGYWQSVPF